HRPAVLAETAITGRPDRDRLRDVLLLDADLPARAAVAVLPVLPAEPGGIHLLPLSGLRADRGRCRRVGTAHDPAVDHTGTGPRRNLHPTDSRLDARRTRRGLHADRASEGHPR